MLIYSFSKIDKSGIKPENVIEFLKELQIKCDRLQFKGLMTIGALATSLQRDENEDFNCLLECRKKINDELNIALKDVGFLAFHSNLMFNLIY